ncbi:hypothetical protein ABPG72_007936 [Tetrahymena utriculariae]
MKFLNYFFQHQNPQNESQKNIKSSKTYQQTLKFESQILNQYSGLVVGESIEIRDVYFNFGNTETFIHTLECGKQNQEVMILIHGYGGSAVTYYQILKQLSEKYHVFAIDIIGMGLSDRQNFNVDNDTRSIIDFFVESINQWRIQLSLEQFVLVGHSFGGYVSANYTVKYSEQVTELFLLSPMAGTQINPFENLIDENDFQRYANNQPFLQKMILKYVRKQHNTKTTIQDLTRKWFVPSKFIIGKALNKKIHTTNKTEMQLWQNYFNVLYQLPESTDHYIHGLITFPFIQAKLSIEQQFEENLNKISQTVHFYFGDSDWMDSTGCIRLSKKLKSTFRYIQNASHQLYFDQPQTIANLLLNPYLNYYY